MASTEPHFVTIAGAATYLGGLGTWDVSELLDAGRIDSRWLDGRRLVVWSSLRQFARSLPATKES